VGFILAVRNETIQLGSLVCGGAFFVVAVFRLEKMVFLLFFTALLIAFSDQLTNVIRLIFKRLRPINDPLVVEHLRVLIRPQSYSFTSGHATTSTAVAVFVILLLRNHFKYIKFFVLFPLVFAYSRLYLGVHYPLDILAGAAVGMSIGYGAYKLFRWFEFRYFDKDL
jgi:undecaprenyl-diphosphatase